ncbi:MAG: nucleotide pyrophosphohydrolase [Promethearchaeota archaeon]
MVSEQPTDQNFTLQQLREIISQFVKERNWESYHTPRALAEAINIEAAEMLEIFLFQPDGYVPSDLSSLTEEMADVFVYILNLANALQIPNFTEIVLKKIKKNGLKYPIEKFSGEDYKKQ